ncbi:MAG TPA: squalene/phytoene synthase family protein [Roseomonas sp.]|jgi:phytoene synthase
MADPLSPIATLVRAEDPDRFLALLFAPPAQREALFALTGFNHELARAREAASNPMAALIRLQWWRDAVEEARDGRPPRRHEVAEPLHAAIRAGALDPADLLAMADAREAETAEEGIPTAGAFTAYLRGTAGGWAVAAGRMLGARGEALALLQRLGAAYGLAGVLRGAGRLAAHGRCLLPADALAEAGLSMEAVIADPRVAAPLLRAMAEEGAARLAEARAEARRLLPRATVAAALPAVLAAHDLRHAGDPLVTPAPRGLAARVSVMWAGLRGRV